MFHLHRNSNLHGISMDFFFGVHPGFITMWFMTPNCCELIVPVAFYSKALASGWQLQTLQLHQESSVGSCSGIWSRDRCWFLGTVWHILRCEILHYFPKGAPRHKKQNPYEYRWNHGWWMGQAIIISRNDRDMTWSSSYKATTWRTCWCASVFLKLFFIPMVMSIGTTCRSSSNKVIMRMDEPPNANPFTRN